jgi:DNA-directed RNA polymerase subunit RPC12/RpoP
MTSSVFQCVSCGSTDLRRSRIHSMLEWLQTMVGTYPFRCLRCNARFSLNIWLLPRLAFAKCPKCLRPEVTSWPTKSYRLPLWKSLMVTFGARKYRCAGCRHRFVSFRPTQKPLVQTDSAASEMDAAAEEIPTAQRD